MSDFNLYGGLYRYVNLVYTPAVHFEQIRIEATTDEKGKQGSISIDIAFGGLSGKEKKAKEFSLRVFSPEGKEVNSISSELTEISSYQISLKRPQLWSPHSPALYTCVAELIDNGDTLRTTQHFGFRHFRFEEKGPFYLNGERLLLRGTHRHEDHAGVGAALTEEMMRTEMQQIKEMGANFIRLGHYQQSGIILRLCDELGLLVWEEIPWCRGGLGGGS